MSSTEEQPNESKYEKRDSPIKDGGLATERSSCAPTFGKAGEQVGERVLRPDDGESAKEATDDVAIKVDRKQMVVLSIAMALAVFLFALDETIIATAIPKITDEFDSLNDVGWYGSAYFLTMCCFQLHFGKFYKLFSTKTVFLVSIAIFEVGSLICAVSPNSSALIVGRALSGSGACGIMSGVLIIISKTVRLRERSMYSAGIGSIRGVAGVAGPLLGGVITDSYLTWRWCFYINLPLGGFVFFIFMFIYRPPQHQRTDPLTILQHVKRLDPVGLGLFVAAMVCLLFGLQLGGGEYPWDDPRIIALFTLFGVLIIAFAALQIRLGDGATLPPRVAKDRTLIFASFFVMTIDGAYYAIAYFLPLLFQAVLGVSASRSGIYSIPQIIGAISCSLLAGLIVVKTGHYGPVVAASAVVTTIACGLLFTLKPHSGAGEWIGYQILVDIGIGLGMQQAAVIVQNFFGPEDIPTAIAAVTLFQASGPTIMVSVAQNVFDQRLASDLVKIIPGISPKQVFNTGATDIRKLVPESQQSLVTNAINDALSRTWLACLIVSALSVVGVVGMKWKVIKK